MFWLLSCNKHWAACIFLNYRFPWIYAQEWHYRNHLLTLFLLFKGTSILFSIVASPIYISTDSVGGFLFLHCPSVFINIICRLSHDGHSDQCEVILHCSFFLPGKFHGWRSLVGYSPWDCKELGTAERLHKN